MRLKPLLAAAFVLTLTACGASAKTGSCPHGLKRMVLFGDSVGYGYGVGNQSSFGFIVAQAMKIPLTNHSVSGHTSSQTLSTLNSKSGGLSKSDFVVIETGGNDFLRNAPAEQTKANLEKAIVLAKSKTPHVALMAVPGKSKAALIGLVSDHPMYKELATQHDVIFVQDVFSETLSNKDLKIDMVHPNVAGHQAMARGFLEQLAQTCETRPANTPRS